MKTHISKTISSCFTALCRLLSIRRSVSQAVLLSLVTSLIMTRLDYGSAVLAGLVTCWIASSLCSMQRRVLCVTIASTTTSLICSRACTGYGFRKESNFDLQCLLSAVVNTRCLRISLKIHIGLKKWNHGIDCGPVPAHEWLFLEFGSALSAIDHFVWLSHVHGTVFLPTTLHQLLCHLSRDNLKHFYLPNLSHHFKLLSLICAPCPRSYFI